MPRIINGIKFHRLGMPGPKDAPEHHHTVLTPITVSKEAASEGAALQKAEFELAQVAGNADELICITPVYSAAEHGVACTLTGIPIKYLRPA